MVSPMRIGVPARSPSVQSSDGLPSSITTVEPMLNRPISAPRSSVVGGVEPTRSQEYKGAISLDMRNFNRVIEVDETSRAARVQAGCQ